MVREELGLIHPAWIRRIQDDATTRARALLDEAAWADAWEEGRKLDVDEAVRLAVDALP